MRSCAHLALLAVLASPALASEQATVAELESAVADLHGKPDKEVAQRIGSLELTQRLTTARLDRLEAEISGEKSRQALLALGDASAFLDLPAADILPVAPPDAPSQGKIMSRAADFVMKTIAGMPDFLATRTITRFQDVKVANLSQKTLVISHKRYMLLDRSSATVQFQNGKEVVELEGKKKTYTSSQGLSNWGVFGPLLGVVMADFLRGKMGWGHWEQGPEGRLAVFRYLVPEDKSSYTVRYCCFPAQNGKVREFQKVPGYHGEIAVDPVSGAVFRLVLITDLDPGLPIFRADVAVEYGPVDIAGKSYICPVKSVSISTSMPLVFKGQAFAPGTVPPVMTGITGINDTVFDKYHQFRTEMRILPGESDEPKVAPPESVPTPPAAARQP